MARNSPEYIGTLWYPLNLRSEEFDAAIKRLAKLQKGRWVGQGFGTSGRTMQFFFPTRPRAIAFRMEIRRAFPQVGKVEILRKGVGHETR